MGRDLQWTRVMREIDMFQSTRPHGARHDVSLGSHGQIDVSIHAPAWGATLSGLPVISLGHSFNPRARMGRDHQWVRMKANHFLFQSTRPHGARP